MKKPDELLFLAQLIKEAEENKQGRLKNPAPARFADEIGLELGLSEKRIYFLLSKWDGKFWESGVTIRSGWFDTIEKAKIYLTDGK